MTIVLNSSMSTSKLTLDQWSKIRDGVRFATFEEIADDFLAKHPRQRQ